MKTAEEPLAEVSVGVSVLAERCKKANGRAEFWVSHYTLSFVFKSKMLGSCLTVLKFCVQVDLHPSGKVMMAVQYFLEDADAGEIKLLYIFILFIFIFSSMHFLLFKYVLQPLQRQLEGYPPHPHQSSNLVFSC